MSNGNPDSRIEELFALVEALAAQSAYQMALTQQSLAHIEGLLAGQRELLARATGQEKTTLSQRQQIAYETALLRIQRELEQIQQSGTREALARIVRFLPDHGGHN